MTDSPSPVPSSDETSPASSPLPRDAAIERRPLPAAAVFLVFLAAGALMALGARVFFPAWFDSNAGLGGSTWINEYGQSESAVSRTRGKLELDEARYDFGEVLDGAHATHRFEFKNTGSEDLTLIELVKPCSCIAFDAIGVFGERGELIPGDTNKDRNLLTLAPAQRGYLDIRTFPVGATSARDVRNSNVVFVTNGMGHERVYLELKSTFLYIVGVEVRRAGEATFRASRQREVDLGTLGRNERGSFWIDLIDLEQGRFDITGEILVDGKPWQEGPRYLAFTTEDSERIGVVMKRLILDIGAPKPVGRLQHEIVVPTTMRGGYDIRLNVRGVVGPDLFLENLSGQREALPRLSYGVLQPGEATTLRRTLQYVGDVPDFKLGAVTIRHEGQSTEPALEVELTPEGSRRWTIEVALPAGAAQSFLSEIEIDAEPADAVPVTDRRFQVQGIVPAHNPRGTEPKPPPITVPRLLSKQARLDLPSVMHGRVIEAKFEVSNPSKQDLVIWRITPHEGPPLRFLRAEDQSGAVLTPPLSVPTESGPSKPPLAVIPAESHGRLVFALDTAPLSRGSETYFASAQVESADPVTPRLRLTARGRVEFPAGLYGTSSDAPDLMLPIQEIWIPSVGRTGSLDHEVHLRPMRTWDGSFATKLSPTGRLPWPSFLTMDTVEFVEPGVPPYVALRFHVSGDKAPSPFVTRVRIETEIGGGYAFEVDVRGEILDDFVFVREEALRDRSGPNGEMIFAHLLRPVQEIALRQKSIDAELNYTEVVRYLGGLEAFAFDPQPIVHWSEPSAEDRPDLQVELLAVEPSADTAATEARLNFKLRQGIRKVARGTIELRRLEPNVEVLRIPFSIQPASER